MLSNDQIKAYYDEFSGLVYSLALNYLQQVEDAEEVTQDVFLVVFQTIEQFKEQSSLKTWIYRITVNKCLDFIKNKHRKKRFAFITSIFDDAGRIKHDKPDFVHPGIDLENTENAVYLYKAIDKLPEMQKMAFILSHIDGLGNKEIAEVTGKSVGSIESLLQRAKENLRKSLQEFYQYYRRN